MISRLPFPGSLIRIVKCFSTVRYLLYFIFTTTVTENRQIKDGKSEISEQLDFTQCI